MSYFLDSSSLIWCILFGYNIRYQISGPEDADHTLLLVHGLFVNSDHWRKTLTGLHTTLNNEEMNGNGSGKKTTCRVYALDLFGCSWSSKLSRDAPNTQLVNGENGQLVDCDSICYHEHQQPQSSSSPATKRRLQKRRYAPTIENIPLGTWHMLGRESPHLIIGAASSITESLQFLHVSQEDCRFYTRYHPQLCR